MTANLKVLGLKGEVIHTYINEFFHKPGAERLPLWAALRREVTMWVCGLNPVTKQMSDS